ncbi:hypothetical protein J1605_001171 [Eschrichtius robustus]|uniref:Uncharacterized protein n=1 Tax=Eschrichtius robustus TaxID=9764 RepID=A0AB34GEB5_ESCRO|nr:hypothetical protein J1605_001171 [Eschrichtius robustus]
MGTDSAALTTAPTPPHPFPHARSGRRPSRKRTYKAKNVPGRRQAPPGQKEQAGGSPGSGSPRRKQAERRGRHREQLGERERGSAEKTCGGRRKRDGRASLREHQAPPKKEKEVPRKEEMWKQLKKHRSSSSASSTSGGEPLSEEELARILEQVEDKKKLIATMRTKPWPMATKLAELSGDYMGSLNFHHHLTVTRYLFKPGGYEWKACGSLNSHPCSAVTRSSSPAPVQISFAWVLIEFLPFSPPLTREAQEFVEKYEGALGKGKGKRLYAYRMLMAKVCGAEAANLWEDLLNS